MMMRPSLTALLLHLTIIAISHAIYLDIHVPLPNDDDCLMTQTLRANELLRSYSSNQNYDSEEVDLFSRHVPHITLFLADFDLELDDGNAEGDESLSQLNVTKVDSFLAAISTINFTQVIKGLDCTISLSTQSFIEHNDDSNNTDKFYTINGAFTMLNVQNTPCLKALSSAILDPVESFVKRPIIVPSWAASLPEPERSAAIYRSRKYGSPNVKEGFSPHLTVGFDGPPRGSAAGATSHYHSSHADMNSETSMQWREDAMEQWNEGFALLMNDGCSSEVKGIAVGRNGIGGTVLANSRMSYWKVGNDIFLPHEHEAQTVII